MGTGTKPQGWFQSLWILSTAALLVCSPTTVMGQEEGFDWPDGAVAAMSLTFDDGLPSQYLVGWGIFKKYRARATFYVMPGPVRGGGLRDTFWDLLGGGTTDGWRDMVAAGHEIGNHTVNHPCKAEHRWVRPEDAAETYDFQRMEQELREANRQIEFMLGIAPTGFAYPCAETTVGPDRKSYIPVIEKMFQSGRRGAGEGVRESVNTPENVPLAEIRAVSTDEKTFAELLPFLEEARTTGGWLVLVGHEIGETGNQTTRVETLEKLIEYAQKPENGFWLAPVSEVVGHIHDIRSK